MCIAADANDRRGRPATVERLSTDHPEDHQVARGSTVAGMTTGHVWCSNNPYHCTIHKTRRERVAMEKASMGVTVVPQLPNDLSKLIRKLRWIGMEDEAQRLQLAARSLPVDERGTVSADL